jgi:hypothetical protein
MSGDSRDYKLDVSSLSKDGSNQNSLTGRPFLSVLFACCGVYQRVYRDAAGKTYRGRCPKCGTPVNFPVGQEGTSARFFRVS